MHLATVKRTFESIRVIYGKRSTGILDDDAKQVLEEAVRGAEYTWNEFKRNPDNHPTWGYEISDRKPLRFKASEVLNGAIVDIYCKLKWTGGTSIPFEQDIKLHVWSDDNSVIFRPQLDARIVEEKLTDPSRLHRGRVISRFHFDRADHSQGKSREYHPLFHMQIGGISNDYELCWHPKNFDIPRIAHHPMELFLACQLVAINFFPETYSDIRQELLWKHQLHATQEAIALEYYEQCVRAIRQKNSLLDHLRS